MKERGLSSKTVTVPKEALSAILLNHSRMAAALFKYDYRRP